MSSINSKFAILRWLILCAYCAVAVVHALATFLPFENLGIEFKPDLGRWLIRGGASAYALTLHMMRRSPAAFLWSGVVMVVVVLMSALALTIEIFLFGPEIALGLFKNENPIFVNHYIAVGGFYLLSFIVGANDLRVYVRSKRTDALKALSNDPAQP